VNHAPPPLSGEKRKTKLFGKLLGAKPGKQASSSPYTETSGDSYASSPVPDSSRSSNRYHRTASTLPINRLIDVSCDQRLDGLIIEGKPSQSDLIDAWENILMEYTELIGSAESKHAFTLERKIALLNCKITLVDICLKVLKVSRNDEAVKELAALGYRRPFNWKDPASYQKDIEAVHSRSKTLIELLRQAEADQERLGRSQKGEKTRADWMDEKVVLGKYLGYRIDGEITTVAEYASIYKSFVKSTESDGSRGKD
jgi:hypothetical protein